MAEAEILFQTGNAGIYGGQSGMGTGLPPSTASHDSIMLSMLHMHSCITSAKQSLATDSIIK